jgi:hypothetical protein
VSARPRVGMTTGGMVRGFGVEILWRMALAFDVAGETNIVGGRVLTQRSGSRSGNGARKRSLKASLVVQNRARRERQDASAQQFKSGSAIHLALRHLKPIDVSFHRSIAPALFDSCLDCTLVLLQRAHKTLHSVEAGRVGLLHSRVQRLDLTRP